MASRDLQWVPGIWLTLLALTPACGGGAVSATVQFQGMIPGCVRLTATDLKTNGASSGTFPVDPSRGQYHSAIYPESSWGASIEVQAEGLEKDCNGATVSRVAEPVSFPGQGFNEVALILQATDQDGDGYVSNTAALPGTDCNDQDHDISPAAPEICDGVDNNCDGRIDEGC